MLVCLIETSRQVGRRPDIWVNFLLLFSLLSHDYCNASSLKGHLLFTNPFTLLRHCLEAIRDLLISISLAELT